jgi:sulfur-oxidizing protein SoxX
MTRQWQILAAACLLSAAQLAVEQVSAGTVADIAVDATAVRDAVVADTLPQPLTVQSGSPAIGRAIFVSREDGHCVLCHRVDGLNAPFQGDVGPDLSAVGARLTPAQIRLRIVDTSLFNPNTIMPPYYRTDGLNQVAVEYRGKLALSAAQVEHLVAYLSALEGRTP